MAFRSLKPYLFDGFYRWCVDDGQTPHIEFEVTPDCALPRPLSDNLGETLTLNISPSACPSLNIDDEGLSFVARFSGVPFQVFIPLAALIDIYSKESKRTMNLNFTEVSMEPGKPAGSGVPSLSMPGTLPVLTPRSATGLPPGPVPVPAPSAPSTPPASRGLTGAGRPERRRHLSLVPNLPSEPSAGG